MLKSEVEGELKKVWPKAKGLFFHKFSDGTRVQMSFGKAVEQLIGVFEYHGGSFDAATKLELHDDSEAILYYEGGVFECTVPGICRLSGNRVDGGKVFTRFISHPFWQYSHYAAGLKTASKPKRRRKAVA